MDSIESYLFGNYASYERFRATAEILAGFVSRAPHAVGIARLERVTGRPAEEIAELCARLERAGLVQPVCETVGEWALACDASFVTLEDVFRCALDGSQDSPLIWPEASSGGTHSDVELLLMQAMITINESLCKHLRQFSLDRLKACAAGVFSAPRRRLSDASLDNDFRLPPLDRDAAAKQVKISVFQEQ